MVGTGSSRAEVVTSIGTLEQWKAFVTSVSSGDDYSGKTVKLAANITMESSGFDAQTVGTLSYPFTGTFDGAGYTLTYNNTGLKNLSYCAPFRYIKNATIKNVKVAGTISVADNHYIGGIVGYVGGTATTDVSYIDNCISSITLTNSAESGDGRIGGIVGYQLATSGLQITNCIVEGDINGRGQAAGVMGYKQDGASLTVSSVYLTSTITGKVNTFVKSAGGEQTIAKCYTTISSPDQGTEATSAKLVSGEIAYELQNGQATLYWGQSNLNKSNAEITPKLTSTNTDKVIKITFTNGSLSPVYANYNGPYNAVVRNVLSFYSGGADGGNYGPYTEDVTVSRSVSKYKLTVTSAGASTLVLPGNVSTLPDGVKAYKLTYNSGEANLTATKVNSIEANKPVLINAAAGTYVFDTDNTGSEITYTKDTPLQNEILYGIYSDTYYYVPANSYVLQNGASGLGFYQVKDANTIKITSFRAYATFTYAAARQFLGIDFSDGEASDIQSVQGEGFMDNDSDEFYDLSGRRVAHPTKGIYVKNGKKYIVK